MRSFWAFGAAFTVSAAVAGPLKAADATDSPAAEAAAPHPALSSREAGARYGQALGAVEICFGSKMTDKATSLSSAYTGAGLEDFKQQAAKVYDAWLKVKDCRRQDDPNQCKIIMDKSCLGAETEIGAKGTALPGLVDFAGH